MLHGFSVPSSCPVFHYADFGGSDRKESAYNSGDLDSIPGLGSSPGGGHSNSLQCPCLENPHGQTSLVGYSLWGPKESDTTKKLSAACADLTQKQII